MAKKKSNKKIVFEPLEPRILLSADFIPIDTAQDEDTLTGIVAEELVIEVETVQEENTTFVIEGLESIEALPPETQTPPVEAFNEQEAISQQQEALSQQEAISEEIVALSAEQQAALAQQFWLRQHQQTESFTQPQQQNAAVERALEVIVIDAAVEEPGKLLDSLQQAYEHAVNSNPVTTNNSDVQEENSILSWGEKFAQAQLTAVEHRNKVVALNENVVVFILDTDADGLSQISNFLQGYANVAALHIFAHGNSGGNLRLGSNQVNSETLNRRQAQLASWSNSFSKSGDILLYACNVAENAENNIARQLAEITQLDVAASNDISGADGDWELEYQSGDVEQIFSTTSLSQWQHSLELTDTIAGLDELNDLGESILRNIDSLANLLEEIASRADVVSGLGLNEAGMDVGSLSTFISSLRNISVQDLGINGNSIEAAASSISNHLNSLVPENLMSQMGIEGSFDTLTKELNFSLKWSIGASVTGPVDTALVDDLNAELSGLVDSDLFTTYLSSTTTNIALPGDLSADYRLDAVITLDVDFGIQLADVLAGSEADFDQLNDESTYIAFNNVQLEITAGVEHISTDLDADTVSPLTIQNGELLLSTVVQISFDNLDAQGRTSFADIADMSFTPGSDFNASLPFNIGFDGIGNLADIGLPVVNIQGSTDNSQSIGLDFQLNNNYRNNLISILDNFASNLDFSTIDLSIPDFPFDIDSLGLLDSLKNTLGELSNFNALSDSVNPFFNLLDSLAVVPELLAGAESDTPAFDYENMGLDGGSANPFADFKTRYLSLLETLFPGVGDWNTIATEADLWNLTEVDTFDVSAWLDSFGSLLEELSILPTGYDANNQNFSALDLAIREVMGGVPTLNGLALFIQQRLPSFSASSNVGPLSFSGSYDALGREIRFDVEFDFHDVLEDALSSANQADLQNAINDLLGNIADLDFLQDIGLSSLSNVNAQLPQLEQMPMFDLSAQINLAFSFGASLEDVINGSAFDVGRDGFVRLDNLHSEFTLSTEDLDAAITLLDDDTNLLNFNFLEGSGFVIGGVIDGQFNNNAFGQRLSINELVALVNDPDKNLFVFEPRVPFDAQIPFGLSGNISGIDLANISNLGTPVVILHDDNLLDNEIILPSLDFQLANDFVAQLVSLFAGGDSNIPTLSLPSAADLNLPFELSELGLGELFDNIQNLFDLSTISSLLQDFSDIFAALDLFNEIESQGSESSFINLQAYEDSLRSLLSDQDIDWDAPDFSINSLDLNLYLGNFNIDTLYREYGSTLDAIFSSPPSNISNFRTGWNNLFGNFPSLNGLGEFLGLAIDRIGAVDFNLGPIEFSAAYDGDTQRFRIEFDAGFNEAFSNLTVDDITAELVGHLSDALDSLGAGGVNGLITEAFDTSSITANFNPLIDVLANLNFSGAFVLDLADAFASGVSALGADDISFEMSALDADIDIDIKQLGFDVDWGAAGTISILDSASLSFPVSFSASLAGPVLLSNISSLFDSISFNSSVGLELFLPVGGTLGSFDSTDFGIPVLTFSNPDITDINGFTFSGDVLISSGLSGQIENAFAELADAIESAANSLNTGIPALQSLLGNLFNGIKGLSELGIYVGDFIDLSSAFNFNYNSQAGDLGTRLGLGAAFDENDQSHRESLARFLNTEFNLNINLPDFDVGSIQNYLPEIYDIVTPEFNLESYLPQFNLLLGLTGAATSNNSTPVAGVDNSRTPATRFNDIRSRLHSYFQHEASLQGLLDFITAILPEQLSGESGGFSFDLNFDNYTLDLGLVLSPQVNANLQDATDFLVDAVGDGLSTLSDLFGADDPGDLNDITLPDGLADILLSAGLQLDIDSTISFQNFVDTGNFDANNDISLNINELSADFSVSGDKLGFNLDLGSFASTGVSDGSLDFSAHVAIVPLTGITLDSISADVAAANINYEGELDIVLPIDLEIAGFDLGGFANPVIGVRDTFNTAETDNFDPSVTLDLSLDISELLSEPINSLVSSISSLGVIDTNLPILDMSLDDMLGIQDYLDNIVYTIDNLAPFAATLSYDAGAVNFVIAQSSLDSVNDAVSSVFGFDTPQIIFSLIDGGAGVDTLQFDLDLSFIIDQLYHFDLNFWDVLASAGIDLGDLGLDIIQIDASVDIGVEGSADFGLHFDINAGEFFDDDPNIPLIFLHSDRNGSATGFELNLDTFGIPDLDVTARLDLPTDSLPDVLADIIDNIAEFATVSIRDGYLNFLPAGGQPVLAFTYQGANNGWQGDVALGLDFAAPIYIADSILLTDAIDFVATMDTDVNGALNGAVTIADDQLAALRQNLEDSASEIINKAKILLLTSNPLYILEELSSNFDPGVDGSVFNVLINDVNSQLNNVPIPFVADAGTRIIDSFEGMLDALFGDFIGGMAKEIRDAGLADASLIDLIQQGIYQLLRGAESAVTTLLNTSFGIEGSVTLLQVVDENGNSEARRYLPVDTDALGEGRIQFEFILAAQFLDLRLPIDFSAGIPGFALDVQDGTNFQFLGDFTLDLGFGFDINASSAGEFLFFATDTGENGQELIINLGARISDNDGNELQEFAAAAQLGFLQAEVAYDADFSDSDEFETAFIRGSMIVDLQDFDVANTAEDESADQVIGVADFGTAFTAYVALEGNLDLRARIGFGLPTDSADVNANQFNWAEHYQDLSNNAVFGGGTDVHLTLNYYRALTGEPLLDDGTGNLVPIADLNGTELIFEGLYLDLSFLLGEDSFLYDIISLVNDDIAGPVEEIGDLLYTEVAFLSDIGLIAGNAASIGDPDKAELIDVIKVLADLGASTGDARLVAAARAVDAFILLFGVVEDLVDLAETLSESAAGNINFGSFRIGDEITPANLLPENIRTLAGNLQSNDANEQFNTDNGELANAALDYSSQAARDAANPARPGRDQTTPQSASGSDPFQFDLDFVFSLDIIENPKSILDIIMGKETDLFTFGFDMSAIFEYDVTQNIAGPLLAQMFFEFNLLLDLDVGFSTRGMNDYLQDLFDGNIAAPSVDQISNAVLQGFYFDDHLIDGVDNPEILLNSTMGAAAGVGISGLVEALVRGGIFGELRIDWGDDDPQFDDTPGRLYLEEIDDCFVDISGYVDAFLEWSIWVGLETPFFTVTVFEEGDRFLEARLIDFAHFCNFDFPQLAQLDANGELTLNVGANIGNRSANQDVPFGSDPDIYQNYDPDDHIGDGTARDETAASRYNIYEDVGADDSQFAGQQILVVEAGGIREEYLRSAVTSINATTGVGNIYDKDGNVKRTSGDTILINLSNAVDDLEPGAQLISVNLQGGDSEDSFRVNGHAADVILNGGGGDDVLVGSDEVDDFINGQAGNDQIAGFIGNDTLVGGAGNDTIDGGDGEDIIWGYLQGEELATLPDGVEDEDKIRGGENADTINAGPGEDTIFWQLGDGSDNINGGGDPASELDTLIVQSYTVNDHGSNQTRSDPSDDTIGVTATNQPLSARVTVASSGVSTDVINFTRITALNIDAGSGADNIAINDLSTSGLRSVNIDNGGDTEFTYDESNLEIEPTRERTPDIDVDNISITLGNTDDVLLLRSPNDKIYQNRTNYEAQWIFNNEALGIANNITFTIQNASLDLNDRLEIHGGDGNDIINASEIDVQAMQLLLDGQDDDDTLIGTAFSETLIGGYGSDIINSSGGVDIFADNDSTHRTGDIDTLYEVRDADFILSHENLITTNIVDETTAEGRVDIVSGEINVYVGLNNYFSETESITYNSGANAIFERVHFVGGTSANRFSIEEFGGVLANTDNAVTDALGNYTVYLDGGAYADIYRILPYAEHPEFANTETRLLIDDSAASVDEDGNLVIDQVRSNDRLLVLGTDERNTFHFNTTFIGADEWGTISRLDDPDDILATQFGVLDQTEFDTRVLARDASVVTEGQHINYSDKLETITVFGSATEDDLFIMDDNIAQINVYGQDGDDRFFIGSVTETGTFPDEKWGMVQYADQLTDGVSYESFFYGGKGNDYFEVNHNAAEIWLYGQEGDDTFFLKAHLGKEGSVNEHTANKLTNISSSDEEEQGEDIETNLVFVKNAPVNIIGGGGYDTLAVAGTAIDDTFWVFVDSSGKQRIYGSGLVVDNVQSIERLMLNTGTGDDSIYIYSTLEHQEVIISTGEDDDLVQFGGPDQNIEFTVPSYVRTETLIEPRYATTTFTEIDIPAHYYFRPTTLGQFLGFDEEGFSWIIGEPAPQAYIDAHEVVRDFFLFALDWRQFFNISYVPTSYKPPSTAITIDGLEPVTYQYEIPELLRGGILVEQADLSQIRGTVKLDVGIGNDELVINAYGAEGENANGSVDRMPVELVNLNEDQWQTETLVTAQINGVTIANVNDIAAIDFSLVAEQIANQLERNNQIEQVGLISGMQNMQDQQTQVQLVDGININRFGGNDENLNEEEIYQEFTAYLAAHGYLNNGPVALENRDARIETYYQYNNGLIDPAVKVYATEILDFAGEVAHVFVYVPGDGSSPDAPSQTFSGANAQANFEAWLDNNNFHRNVKAEIFHELDNGNFVFGSRHYVFTGYDNGGNISSIDVYQTNGDSIAGAPLISWTGANAEEDLDNFLANNNLVLDLEGSSTNPDAPPLPLMYRTALEGRVAEVYAVETRTRDGELLYIDLFALDAIDLTIDNTFIDPDAELNIQFEYWDAVRGFGSTAGVYFNNMGREGTDRVTVNLGDADNIVEVNQTALNSITQINFGGGNDTANVFGAAGELVLSSESGSNTYNIGSDERSAELIGKRPSTNPDSAIQDPGYINYQQASSLVRIEGGSGSDVVNINDRARTNQMSDLEIDVLNLQQTTQTTVNLPNWVVDQVVNRFENVEVTQNLIKELGEQEYELVAIEQLRSFNLDADGNLVGEVLTGETVEHRFNNYEELLAFVNQENYWQRHVLENNVTGALSLQFHELISITEVVSENYIGVTGMGAANAYVNINYNTVEALNVMTGDDSDRVRVGATSSEMLTRIFTEGGRDHIHVYQNSALTLEQDNFGSNHSRTLDTIYGALVIDAGAGSNELIISDEGDQQADVIRLLNQNLDFSTPTAYSSYVSTNDNGGEIGIHYTASGGDYSQLLQTRAGMGDDNITVENLFAGNHSQVFGGAGHDDIIVNEFETLPTTTLSLYGQSGNDVIDATQTTFGVSAFGQAGDDSIYGSEYNDFIADTFTREASNVGGDDLFIGNGGDDTIYSSQGADIVFGDYGNIYDSQNNSLNMRDKFNIDTIRSESGSGEDTLYLGSGDTFAFAGGGNDEINTTSDKFSRNIVFADNGEVRVNSLDNWGFDVISARAYADDNSGGDDRVTTSGANNIVFAGLGNDTVIGGEGADIILGDNGQILFRNNRPQEISVSDSRLGGRDTIYGGDGDDIILAGLGEDSVFGGSGNEVVLGDLGTISLRDSRVFQAGTAQDFVGNNDLIDGGDGEDVLIGGGGKDELIGNFKQDTMLGYFGRITFDLDSPDQNKIKYFVRVGQGDQDLVGMAYSDLYTVADTDADAESSSSSESNAEEKVLPNLPDRSNNLSVFEDNSQWRLFENAMQIGALEYKPAHDGSGVYVENMDTGSTDSIEEFCPAFYDVENIESASEKLIECILNSNSDKSDQRPPANAEPGEKAEPKELDVKRVKQVEQEDTEHQQASTGTWKYASLALVAAKAKNRNEAAEQIRKLDEQARRRRFTRWKEA